MSSAIHPLPVAPAQGLFRLEFRAMGTRCALQFVAETMESAVAYRDAAFGWVRGFESRYTRFREDSLIGRINAAAGREPVRLEPRDEALFEVADSVVRLSGGWIDPSTLPLTLAWSEAAKAGRLPGEAVLQRARALTGWSRVQRVGGAVFLPEEGMALDFGGFGKEYAVDRVLELAERHGIRSVLVDFGGDARGRGAPPDAPFWVAGVEDACRPGRALRRVALRDGAIASSGNYQRYVEIGGRRYGHLVDPRTGYPSDSGVLAASVLAPTCLEAGILSTGAYLRGPADGWAAIDAAYGAEGCLQEPGRIRETRFFHHHEIPE